MPGYFPGYSPVKGRRQLIFVDQAATGVADSIRAIDCQEFNAIHLETTGSGSSPSAWLSVLEAMMPGMAATQAPDPNGYPQGVGGGVISYDVAVGAPYAVLSIEIISGTFTVWATPYRSGGGMTSQPGHVRLVNVNATVQAIKARPGFLFGLTILNNQGVATYVQIFDFLAANVTVGSTVPAREYLVAANSQLSAVIGSLGIQFAKGIVCAATTTQGGATGSAAGVFVQGERI